MALAGFAVLGARRGLIRTLAGLVIVACALAGASMAASAFSGPIADLAAPLIEARIESRVDEALEARPAPAENPAEDSPEDLLALLGLDRAAREDLAEDARDAVRETGVTALEAVAESLARSAIYGAVYVLAFLALTALLHVLAKAMDLLARLPVLHGLNALGGGALGLVEAVVLILLAVWVLRRMGAALEADPWAEARLFQMFAGAAR